MKKRLTALFLAALLCFSFAACAPADVTSALPSGLPDIGGGHHLKCQAQGSCRDFTVPCRCLLALGYEKSLKGRSAACTQADLSALPVLELSAAADAQKIRTPARTLCCWMPSPPRKSPKTCRTRG
jgi:hypothetical protein